MTTIAGSPLPLVQFAVRALLAFDPFTVLAALATVLCFVAVRERGVIRNAC
ncbi:hypothetical protein [Bosea thiooxidans]